MRTAFLMAFMIGLSTAAIQQRASPVYQPTVTSTGSTPSIGPPMKAASYGRSTPMTPPTVPATSVPPQPVAEARESVAGEASMLQPVVGSGSTPSQNYYVYYYPKLAEGQAQPNSNSIWSSARWGDVAAGVGSIALVLVGGGILYSRYGTEVKSRALRELKDLSADDAARMARGVLRALEKFSSINTHSE